MRELNLAVDWILESHVHADHLSAASYLKSVPGGRIGIGAGITAVQRAFGMIYNLDAVGAKDGSHFDHLFANDDYQPGGRAPRFKTTIGAQKASNIHVAAGTREDYFVAMRRARDARLRMPALMLPAVQVNMRAGRLPEPEDNGVRYLRIPLNAM